MFNLTPLELKAAAQKIPASPQIFTKLNKLLKDRNADTVDITKLVNTDASLTAKVIKISNSPAFNYGDPIDSLEDAIGRVGFAEMLKVVGVAAAANAFMRKSKVYDVVGATLWENSVAVGFAMEYLAKVCGEDQQEAYTLGLLKSMGKLIIDVCTRKFIVPPKYPAVKKIPLLEWEKACMDTTNCEAARVVLESWNFPEVAIRGIENQYIPDLAPTGDHFSRMLNVASGVAEKVGKLLPGESSYWDLSEDSLAMIDLQPAHIDRAISYVKSKFDNLAEAMAA